MAGFMAVQRCQPLVGPLRWVTRITSRWGDCRVYRYLGLGARGAYHYGLFDSDKIDTYAGLALGYNVVSSSWIGFGHEYYSASSGYLMYGGFLGLRYYPLKPHLNLGVYTELGYGLGLATIGVSFKF